MSRMSAKIAESSRHVQTKLLPVSRSSTASAPDHHDTAAATTVTGREQSSPSPPPSPSIHPSSFLPFASPIPRIFFSLSTRPVLPANSHWAYSPVAIALSLPSHFSLAFSLPARSLKPSPTGCISQPSRFPLSPRNLIYVVIHTKESFFPVPVNSLTRLFPHTRRDLDFLAFRVFFFFFALQVFFFLTAVASSHSRIDSSAIPTCLRRL